jgi:hypothetical protein
LLASLLLELGQTRLSNLLESSAAYASAYDICGMGTGLNLFEIGVGHCSLMALYLCVE